MSVLAAKQAPTPHELLARYPLAEIERDLGSRLPRRLARDPKVLADLAAVDLTLWVWRNSPFENVQNGSPPLGAEGDADVEWVGGLDDQEMMRANIEASRVVRSHISATGADWDGIVATLTDRARLVAGAPLSARSAQWAVEELYRFIPRKVALYRTIEQQVGWPRLFRWMALMGTTSSWWGTPWWGDAVDEWLSNGLPLAEWGRRRPRAPYDDPEVLGPVLREDPLRLPPSVLAWVLRTSFRGQVGLGSRRFYVRVGDAGRSHSLGVSWVDSTVSVPHEWRVGVYELQRWAELGPFRAPEKQVMLRGDRAAMSVWATSLDELGLARLVGLAAEGEAAHLNGNPLPEFRNQPTYLAFGSVRAVGSGWAVMSLTDVSLERPVWAVFLTRTPARTDSRRIARLVGKPDDFGRLHVHVWTRLVGGVVRALHYPTVQEFEAALPRLSG